MESNSFLPPLHWGKLMIETPKKYNQNQINQAETRNETNSAIIGTASKYDHQH